MRSPRVQGRSTPRVSSSAATGVGPTHSAPSTISMAAPTTRVMSPRILYSASVALLAALREIFGADQDLARLGAAARPDDTVLLHHVDEARRLRISQTHAALQERDRGLALPDHQVHGVPVEVVPVGVGAGGDFLFGRQHDLLVDRGALLAQE